MAKRKPKAETPVAPDLKHKIPEILEKMIDGNSLRSICVEEGMPHIATFLRWVSQDEELKTQYALAMELRADYHHEEMFDIADDGSNDWMERTNKDGECIGWMVNGEAVGRSKLRLEQRRWSTARMNPKKYGDKVDLNHGGRVKVIPLTADDEAV